MSDTRKDRAHRARDLERGRARREEHREEHCTHGLPRTECDACIATGWWLDGVRTRTIVEALEVEGMVTSVPLPLGSAYPSWRPARGKGDY